MRIIPAIDLINGQCVRLTKGDYNSIIVYNDDPIQVAKNFEKAGFKQLHLVDLDGAKAGEVINSDVLERITRETSLQVDFGGGVKTIQDLDKVLEAGAFKVTIGSLAVKDPDTMKKWIKEYGADKFILGADVIDLKIAISGWLETSSIDLFDFINEYYELGIRDVLCTDISKDGMLQGPSFELYKRIMDSYPDLKLIASGGVSNLRDVEELKRYKIPAVVIGKALYEGRIQLNDLSRLND